MRDLYQACIYYTTNDWLEAYWIRVEMSWRNEDSPDFNFSTRDPPNSVLITSIGTILVKVWNLLFVESFLTIH